MTCLNQDLCIGDTEVDDLYEKKKQFALTSKGKNTQNSGLENQYL